MWLFFLNANAVGKKILTFLLPASVRRATQSHMKEKCLPTLPLVPFQVLDVTAKSQGEKCFSTSALLDCCAEGEGCTPKLKLLQKLGFLCIIREVWNTLSVFRSSQNMAFPHYANQAFRKKSQLLRIWDSQLFKTLANTTVYVYSKCQPYLFWGDWVFAGESKEYQSTVAQWPFTHRAY